MGNRLSCSCAPLLRKGYSKEDAPWQGTRRRDGHLLRLWAEVFHVTTGGGTVRWQQVSEDLVPVNVTCVQDHPECIFHVTAYNSHVDKILDVRITQPGTRIGQASECFVYWKDPVTGDTWGLNFTSPVDAKQFRECCSLASKFSRKASSSYSLRLDSANRVASRDQVIATARNNGSLKRRTISTPSSPSHSREPQCTCMTAEQYARLRSQDPRYRGTVTLPRNQCRPHEDGRAENCQLAQSSSLNNTVDSSSSNIEKRNNETAVQNEVKNQDSPRQTNGSNVQAPSNNHTPSTVQSIISSTVGVQATDSTATITAAQSVPHLYVPNIQPNGYPYPTYTLVAAPGYLGPFQKPVQPYIVRAERPRRELLTSKSVDYSLMKEPNSSGGYLSGAESEYELNNKSKRKNRSKSTENVNENNDRNEYTIDSGTLQRMIQPVGTHSMDRHVQYQDSFGNDGFMSEPETSSKNSRVPKNSDAIRRNFERSLYLDLQRGNGSVSPQSDQVLFEHGYYATTPSSSPANSDMDGEKVSPTSQLLLEYEKHLRSTLAKGLDAESCSLHTFEAMLSQSMENLGVSSNTLPLPPKDPARMRAKSADRGSRLYATDKDRGYLSDFSSRANSLCERQDSVRSGYMSDRESIKMGVVQQGSVESADSRLCYLTSSEVSDDDRMSLTTAISDDEDGGGSADGQSISPHRSKKVAAAAFNCTGAVRKAGFLSVKKWLIRKRHQIELAHKRGWRGYWVCLKGTTLLFYPCDARDGRGVEAAPRHLIIVDGAILQPIPEHPKRDFVFCLSTAFGDAYLFQAPCQAELENWVNSIHSACAAAFARHRGKTGTLHLLQEEIYRIERSIESDSKLRHMAELQCSVVSDSDSRRQIAAQIAGWDDTLERLHCEQFRLRCYMASLQRGELPNPKGLLGHVSRSTKSYLNRLGVFTVSSLHAYICARSPSLLNNLLAGRGATRRRSVAQSLSRSNSLGSRRGPSQSQETGDTERFFTVSLPDGQSVNVAIRDGMTVEEFLSAACNRRGVNPAEHFVRVKKRRNMDASNHFVPHRGDPIDSYVPSHEIVEICAKALYQVELTRTSLEHRWGFSVEAELVENADRQDELGCIVSRVEETGLAAEAGLQKSDEIMVLNGALVADLDMMYIESVLQEELSLCLMLRSCRADPPAPAVNLSLDLNLIDSLVCPPPPSDPLISDDMITGLIVPAPSTVGTQHTYVISASRERGEGGNEQDRGSQREQEAIEKNNLIKAKQRMSPTGCVTPSQSRPVTPGKSMSEADRLRKVLKELVGTERTYVQHLNCLLENYLEPLQKQTLLSTAEINALFGNIREIVAFQRLFLAGLESALDSEPNLEELDRAEQFQDVLCSVAGTFLRYVYHFRLYSSFCASHSKAQKILHPVEGSSALQAFLAARNPGHQHSSTLESHLIRPIQRVLHYPLLLTQLKTLTMAGTEEYKKIDEALRGMERVAEHINEMQRIHEEYGAIFEHLARQHQRTTKQAIDLSPGALLHYGGVEWLNLTEFLGKVKRGLELHAMTFVFSSAVIFLCKERLRQKRKIMSVSSRPNGEVEVIRYQVLIPVSEVQVRSAATKSPESNYRWELVHLRNQFQKRAEKVYSLSNSTAEFRNAFLKTIRQIIRESVRNMNVPSSKINNPRSQDYDNLEPKKDKLRSQTLSEPREEIIHRSSDGTEPDTEDDTKSSTSTTATQRRRSLLGRTPNHLSLSTTSTISTGSGGSQSVAKLVHASNTPAQYKPQAPEPLSSPVWKPRDDSASSFTLPRANSSGIVSRQNSAQSDSRRVPYATLGRSGAAARANSVRHLDC
ncbi:protein still life, isoform SIF type 1-like isoform X2 [Artemia franciscana]|uniref:Still life n=1 Tax=Artemia franciscana TaxID=6661 RepID=A0AA88LBI4_ARTSF|nr:hypothetical protein QYM36_010083 [Artemia franciscana]